jgi:hypothetical protein
MEHIFATEYNSIHGNFGVVIKRQWIFVGSKALYESQSIL